MSAPCMEEETGRQTGVTGWLPVRQSSEADGPCGRLFVVDEEKGRSVLVSPETTRC